MPRNSGQQLSVEDTEREIWVKLVLLFVALVLVAGYAATLTNMGAVVREKTAWLLQYGVPLLALTGALAVTAGMVIVFLRRRAKRRGIVPDKEIDALPLRAAKHVGGETSRLYAREREMAAEARRQMEKAIEDALRQGWFKLRFQPQYDLRRCRLTGFEALVRMNHPELGELLPDVFLPVAEECGLIEPLGEWITREAIAIAALWPPHLTLAINVSPAQFRDGDVNANIMQALSTSGFEATRLRVEISEAVLLQKAKAVQDQLRRLKARGVTIVLDDFGLGSSGLQSLSLSPCDAVKIDRSLIQQVGEGPETEDLIRSLIGTAQSFDLAVMAEGIERVEQAHFLMSNACRNVQGFLFGRPARTRDLAAIIAKDLRNAMPGDGPRTSGRPATAAA
jgi:EAL domain-containing protein (putative c-di-GMP-specific phosphodiesterase class I)